MKEFSRKIPGILLTLLIATPAWFLGRQFPIIGGPVIAIVAGMLIANVFPGVMDSQKINLQDGVRFTSKKLLQYSIILLGFEMNLFNVVKVGSQSLLIMLFTLTAAFLVAFFVGRLLKLPGDTTTLIGVGTSICGGSAIAATAPVIRAKDEDVTQAISTIFLFNIVAVFLFPALGRLIGLSDTGFGIWAGTAINDTSSVVAAGAAWSIAAGNNTALEIATIVKLTRTLMIVPITLFLSIYTMRKAKSSSKGNFKFTAIFPWFVIFFIVAAIINTFAGLPGFVSGDLVLIGKFVIVMAMAAIGLNTRLKVLLANGIKPIVLGLLCWFAVAVVSLLAQNVIGYY